jgi:hypothetical protein
MLKYLRIAVTALSLAACLLLVALWVRSYWRRDVFHVYYFNQVTTLGSNYGFVYLIHTSSIDRWSVPNRFGLGSESATKTSAAFQWTPRYGGIAGKTLLKAPYWFVTPLIFAIAAIPWIERRFSLCTLLIATALVAVALGLIVMSL